MKRNTLYLIVGALIAVLAVVGYMLYQEQQASSIDINFGEGGVSVETE